MQSRVLALVAISVVMAGGAAAEAPAAQQTLRPTVQRTSAYGIDEWSAVMVGKINPHGIETAWYFQIGTTRKYGLRTLRTSLERPIVGSGPTGVEEAINCLAPETTYHFRLVAKNRAGRSYGHDQTFTTSRAHGSIESLYSRCPGHKPLT